MADNMEKRVNDLETKTSVIETKIDQFIGEMRQQNEMRAREIAEMRAKQDADAAEFRRALTEQQERHDQRMEQLRMDVKEISKEVRSLFVAFVGIIIAIMIGVFWNNASVSSRDTAAPSVDTRSNDVVVRNAEIIEGR